MDAVPVSSEKNTRGTMSIFKSRRKRSPIQLRLRLASLKRSPKTAPTANPIKIHPSSPIRRPSAMTLSSIPFMSCFPSDLDPSRSSLVRMVRSCLTFRTVGCASPPIGAGNVPRGKGIAKKERPSGVGPPQGRSYPLRRPPSELAHDRIPKDVRLPRHPPQGNPRLDSFGA